LWALCASGQRAANDPLNLAECQLDFAKAKAIEMVAKGIVDRHFFAPIPAAPAFKLSPKHAHARVDFI
jgi:hypothetical protein